MTMQRKMPFHKYKQFPAVNLPDRQWPNRRITHAPLWCSVDLRDGNQALIQPMTAAEKLKMFQLLVSLGFKEIEVGFPASSRHDFDFVRTIIEENLIPDDVTIQVLSQAREPIIAQTIESLRGCKRAIFHLYNSTSPLQRRVVFRASKEETIALATNGTRLVKALAAGLTGSEIRLEYSPESFTATELDFATEICHAVMEEWGASEAKKVILNLPATVEMSTPNVYADQVEWLIRHLPNRKAAIISLHTHNDRGTTIAASELGLLAGAERVEGCLFGNGERTGNCDLVTMAMNLFSQGIDPELYLSDMPEIVRVAEECNKIDVHVRHPYAGKLVFTAFSGSHQDAIRKGMAARAASGDPAWEVPYLPIDPTDVGSSYRETVRVNSQSGRGGLAYVLERDYGITLPQALLTEFGGTIQTLSEQRGGELLPETIWQTFEREYVNVLEPYVLAGYDLTSDSRDTQVCRARISDGSEMFDLIGRGTGPVAAFVSGLAKVLGEKLDVASYREQALEPGTDARAICTIELVDPTGVSYCGAGVCDNTVTAALKAVLSATNRRARLKSGRKAKQLASAGG